MPQKSKSSSSKKVTTKKAPAKAAVKKKPVAKVVAKKKPVAKKAAAKTVAKKVAPKKPAAKTAAKKVAAKKVVTKTAVKKTPVKAVTQTKKVVPPKKVVKAPSAKAEKPVSKPLLKTQNNKMQIKSDSKVTQSVVAASKTPLPSKKKGGAVPASVASTKLELPKLAAKGVAVARLSAKDKSHAPKTTVLHPDLEAVMKDASSASKKAIEGMGFMGIPPYQPKANEEYMNDKQREHFRQILNLWKRVLMEEVDRTVHHMQDDAANFPDPNDRATQEEEFSLELRTRDRERKLIKKIEEALVNLEEDDYGFCEMCGIEIGIRRLEARPTATLCIDCKTMDEIRERQGNS